MSFPRLFQVASVALAIHTACWLPAADAQISGPARFVGRDFWKLQPSVTERVELTKLVGSVPKGFMMQPVPWHVWAIRRGSETRYVVLLGEDLMIIPGGSSACVEILDGTGRVIRTWSFPTGWRMRMEDASLDYSAELNSDLLIIRTSPVINGRDTASEFFAVGDDQLRLIRLEDSKGTAVQNEYVFPNFEIGFIPEAQTTQDWVDLLQSKDKSEVLSALVFLGGRHISEEERLPLPEPRESKYAMRFQQLLASPAIQGIIVQLATSDDRWIKEAAVLAARGARQRLLR